MSLNHSVNVSWTLIMCQPLFGLWEWDKNHSSKGTMPITTHEGGFQLNTRGGVGVNTLYEELKDSERMHLGIYWHLGEWDGAMKPQ